MAVAVEAGQRTQTLGAAEAAEASLLDYPWSHRMVEAVAAAWRKTLAEAVEAVADLRGLLINQLMLGLQHFPRAVEK